MCEMNKRNALLLSELEIEFLFKSVREVRSGSGREDNKKK